MADFNADVREDETLTEAQILAGGTKEGQVFHASDTKRAIFYSNVDLKYYDDVSGAVWNSTSQEWEGGVNASDITQNTVNIQANADSIEALEGATIKIAQTGGTFATTEVQFDFDTVTPSDNEDLLTANDSTNVVTLKKQLRYSFQTYIAVNSTGAGDKTLTLRVRNSADDSLLSERDVEIEGGGGKKRTVSLDPVFVDNPIDDLEIYFTAQNSDTELDLIELNTTIGTGSGGSNGGLWEDQNGVINNIGNRPLNITVDTVNAGDVAISDTGTAFDSVYADNGNSDSFSNSILDDGTNTLIKDNTDNYWCLVSGLVTANPAYTTTQYCNFTGSISGPYTTVLGSGANGTGVVVDSTDYGAPAVTANAEVVAPVFEITDKNARRWSFDGDYLLDTIIEPATGATYVLSANGKSRWAIPVGGSGNATQGYRSMLLGGYTVGSEEANTDTNVGNTFFDDTFIDCNTGSDGNDAKPDLGVGGGAQIVDGILVGEEQATGDRVVILPASISLKGETLGTKEHSISSMPVSNYVADYANGNSHVFATEGDLKVSISPVTLPTGKACQMTMTIDNAVGAVVTDANDVELIRAVDTGVYLVLIDVKSDGTIYYSSNAPFFRDDVVTLTGDQTAEGVKEFSDGVTVNGKTIRDIHNTLEGDKEYTHSWVTNEKPNIALDTEDISSAVYNKTGTVTAGDFITYKNIKMMLWTGTSPYHYLQARSAGGTPIVATDKYIVSYYIATKSGVASILVCDIANQDTHKYRAVTTTPIRVVSEHTGWENIQLLEKWQNPLDGNTDVQDFYIGGIQIEKVNDIEKRAIVAMGDSTVQGSAGAGTDNWDNTEWVKMMGMVDQYDVYNRGIGGDKTADMIARWATDITPLKDTCKYVFIQGGVNDFGNAVTADVVLANHATMHGYAITDGLIPIHCTCTPFGGDTAEEVERNAFNTALKEKYLGVFDLDKILASKTDPTVLATEWIGDGVHFSQAGKNMIASKLIDQGLVTFSKPARYERVS